MRVTAAVLTTRRSPWVEDVELLEPVLTRCRYVGRQRRLPQRPARDHGDSPHPLPVVLGHEARARREGRPGCRDRAPGDHVCSSYIPSCGKCWYCIGGQPTMCALRDKPAGSCSTAPRAFARTAGPPPLSAGRRVRDALGTSGRKRHFHPEGRSARRRVARELRRARGRRPGLQTAPGAPGATVAVWAAAASAEQIQAARLVGAAKIMRST